MSSIKKIPFETQKKKFHNIKKDKEFKDNKSQKEETASKRQKDQKNAKLNQNKKIETPLTTNSLVRFDTPFLVSSTISNKKLLEELDENNEKSELFLKDIMNSYTTESTMDYSIKDALNKILPPLKIKDGDQMWVKYVSCTPVTKAEVINLYEGLKQRLEVEQIEDSGISSIREQLYNECFDEIIRQVTINCLERGILLMRIKTEIEMTINSYKTLYESNLAYGIRKFLTCEKEKKQYSEEIYKIEDECDELTKKINELEKTLEEKMKKDEEDRKAIIEKHNKIVEEYRWRISGLKEDIKEKFSFHNK